MLYYTPEQTEISFKEAVLYATLIITASFINTILGHAYTIHNLKLGMKVRIACTSLIYRKVLRLSQNVDTTLGHMINLISNDVSKLMKVWARQNSIWSSPLETVLIMYLLYIFTDFTSLVGILLLISIIPIQSKFL